MGNEAKKLIELALLNGVNFMATFALDFDLALDENAFEEQLVAVRTAVFLECDSHRDLRTVTHE